MSQMLPRVRIVPDTDAPPGAVVERPNEFALTLNRLEVKVDAITQALANIGTNVPEVALILAEMQAKLDAQQVELEAEIRDAVADLGEGGAAQVRADAEGD
jgi:hypothetical protein